jgi:hypothetical protein
MIELSTLREWLRELRKHPRRAFAFAGVAVVVALGAIFFAGYLGEKGRQAAHSATEQPRNLTAVRLVSEQSFLRESTMIDAQSTLYLLRLHPDYDGRPPLNGMAAIPNSRDTPIPIPWVKDSEFVQRMTIENAGDTTLLDGWFALHVDFVTTENDGSYVGADAPVVGSKKVFVTIPKTLRPGDRFETFIANTSDFGTVITFPTELTAQILGETSARALPLPRAYGQLNSAKEVLLPGKWPGMPTPVIKPETR